MRFLLKPTLGRISLILSICSLLSFWVFYIPNYVMESEPMALTYFRLFFGEFIDFLIIPIAVVFLYYKLRSGKRLSALIPSALALAATRCIMNLPYYYLLETALGSDWIESTLSSVLFNIVIVTIDLAVMLLFTLLVAKLSEFLARKHPEASLDGAENYGVQEALKVITPDERSFFAVSLIVFFYNIASEVIDIAGHLAEYGSFRSSELIFVVSKFVFLIALLVLSYVLQCLLYNCYRKAHKNGQGI